MEELLKDLFAVDTIMLDWQRKGFAKITEFIDLLL